MLASLTRMRLILRVRAIVIFPNLTGGPGLNHRAVIFVDCDHFERCARLLPYRFQHLFSMLFV